MLLLLQLLVTERLDKRVTEERVPCRMLACCIGSALRLGLARSAHQLLLVKFLGDLDTQF